MTTPDSLWAEIAPLVVLPDGSRPLMGPCLNWRHSEEALARATADSCFHCHDTALVPIPRSLPAALAAIRALRWGYQVTSLNESNSVRVDIWYEDGRSGNPISHSADTEEQAVYGGMLEAMEKKERDA